MYRSARQFAGKVCYVLGILWAASGALKALFGVMITLPGLPPLDLQRVHQGSAMVIGCCLYFAGAWLSRGSIAPLNQPATDPVLRPEAERTP